MDSQIYLGFAIQMMGFSFKGNMNTFISLTKLFCHLFEKGSTLKEKNLLPLGSILFFTVGPFQKELGMQKGQTGNYIALDKMLFSIQKY